MKNIRLKNVIILLFIIVTSFSLITFNPSVVLAEELNSENINVKEEFEEKQYSESYKRYLKLSDEEKAELGVIPEKYEYSMEDYFKDKSSEISFFGTEVILPSSYNLRDDIYIETENQGSYNTCWAFASNKTVETYVALNNDVNVDLSEMHVDYLTSREFYDVTGKGNPYRTLHEGGNFSIFYDGYAIYEYGPVLESQVPLEEVNVSNYSSLLSYRPIQYVYDVKRFPDFRWETDSKRQEVRNDVKKHIMTNGSLYASICANNIYYATNGDAVLNEQNMNNLYNRNHAISIIGWDDNYSKYNFPASCRPENDGAYIALNSWGEYFGDNGVFYISYDDILVEGEMRGVTYVDDTPYSIDSVTFYDSNLYESVLNIGFEEFIISKDPTTLTIVAKDQYFRVITSMYIYAAHDFRGLEKFVNLDTLFVYDDYYSTEEHDYSYLAQLENIDYISFGNIKAKDWMFLNDFEYLEFIELFNVNMTDLNILTNITTLKGIYVSENSYSNYSCDVDFSLLPNLTMLYLYLPTEQAGDVKIINLPDLIETLYIDRVKFDYSAFNGKYNLIELNIANTNVENLSFLSVYMDKLQFLILDNTNTIDIGNLENLNHNINVDFYNTVVPDFYNLLFKDNLKFYFHNCYKTIDIEKPLPVGLLGNVEIPDEILFFENDYYTRLGYDEESGVKLVLNNASKDKTGLKFVVKTEEVLENNMFNVYIADKTEEKPTVNFIAMYTFYYDTKNVEDITEPIATVNYRTHVEKIGWQAYVSEGNTSGTEGRGLRLEGINIDLISNISGGIEYTTHVQNIGWQAYVSDDEMAGTSGRGLRLEGIKIRLTGELAELYDIYYRVHTQNEGWLSWAKNDETAGSSGYGYRLEGIQIVIVPKDEEPPEMNPPANRNEPFVEKVNVIYQTHTENIGWQQNVRNGATQGAPGRHLRIEGIKIKTESTTEGSIRYATHVENIGWQGFVNAGQDAGTEGRALRLEGIKIELTGELAEKYDVYYRIYVENMGWLDWAVNGMEAGSTGYGLKLEGIEIRIQKKGKAAPGPTENACYNKDAPIIGEE